MYTPSNTSIPESTALTTLKGNLIASRTFTHLCNTSHSLQWDTPNSPKKMPFPLVRSPPHLIHTSFDRPHSPIQMASRSNQPFFHNSPTGQTDTPTDNKPVPVPADALLYYSDVAIKIDLYSATRLYVEMLSMWQCISFLRQPINAGKFSDCHWSYAVGFYSFIACLWNFTQITFLVQWYM